MSEGKNLTRRGFVLFITISVLALLALLASSFAVLSRTERTVSRNYVDKARAKLLAHAGVERAIIGLKTLARTQAWEDLTGSGLYADGPGIPIEYSKFPSFQAYQIPVPMLPALPSPWIVPGAVPTNFSSAGNTNGISGALAATYPGGWDCYTDKVLDAQSMVDLNMTNPNLPAILDALGDAIQAYLPTINYAAKTGRPVVNPIPAGFGATIVAFRTANGGLFRSKSDLLNVPGMTQDRLMALQDFVGVECYRDTKAILPNPDANFPSGQYTPTAASGTWIGRAPMNINTAPYPVLVAWAESVAGYRMATPAVPPAGFQYSPWSKTPTAAITKNQAYNIARLIVLKRQGHPFRTLDDVANFIWNPYRANVGVAMARDPWQSFDLAHDPSVNLTDDQAAALMALADPSLTTNKFFPANPWTSVDKCDLTYYTWETCFSSMGFFEIESMGRVMPPNPQWPNTQSPNPLPGNPPLIVCGEAKAKTVVRLYNVFRQTTQSELETGGSFTNTLTLPERAPNLSSTFEGATTMKVKALPTNGANAPDAWANLDSNFEWSGTRGGANGLLTVPGWTNRDLGPLFQQGDLLTDGILTVANARKQFTLRVSNQPASDQGAVEFWVRLTTPPTYGSGESLMYLVTTKFGDPGGESTGGGVKLERWGTRLIATRFMWGYPLAAGSPYYFLTSNYQLGDVSQWHVGTWHHLAVEWKDYDAPQGAIAPADVPAWEAGAREQRDVWFWIDGVQQAGFFQRWAPTTTQLLPGNIQMTTFLRLLMASKVPVTTAPWPSTSIDLGGYSFNSPGRPIDYVNQSTVIPAGPIALYTNSVIDDLRVYKNGDQWPHGSNLPGVPFDRFTTAGGSTYGNSFNLATYRAQGKFGQNAILGTISWQQRQPAWGASVSAGTTEVLLWPTNGVPTQSPYANCSWPAIGGYPAQANKNTYGALGGANYPLNSVAFNAAPAPAIKLGATGTLPYTLTFQNTGNVPFTTAPVVEEVMITIIDAPQFMSWEAY